MGKADHWKGPYRSRLLDSLKVKIELGEKSVEMKINIIQKQHCSECWVMCRPLPWGD